jgi:DNA polymerase-3 subunit epsilon
MREIAFDTETTGLSPNDGHRLVEIGCVELVNRVETGRTYHCYLNPDRSMPSEAEAVHGLSAIFLGDKPRFPEVVADFLDFIGDSPLVAHNANFDFGFLNWELAACGHAPVSLTRMIDTLQMARSRHPGAKHSLDALCNRYGVDRSSRVKHGALLDAQLLAQVYVELAGGRQIGLSLAATPSIAAGAETIVISPKLRTVRPPRPHGASLEELGRHAAFLSTVVDPLWNGLSPTPA